MSWYWESGTHLYMTEEGSARLASDDILTEVKKMSDPGEKILSITFFEHKDLA